MAIFTKKQVLASLFWKFMERGGAQLIQFLVQIVLARLLLPKDYGLITLVSVFITIASLFVESGFSTALIQKKNADELDFSSVFYFSLLFSAFLYLVLFISAPWIASYYSLPNMISVLRVLSVSLIFGAVNSVQNAIVSRKLQFKLLFFRSTTALLISGVLGIVMAYMGYGVWALVIQSLSYRFLVTIILWFTLRWRPTLTFSLSRLKVLFVFSWKLLFGTLINSAYREIRNLIIGKLYQPSMLGYYNRGQQFPNLLVSNIDGSIQSVMFPVLAAHQDDRDQVKKIMRQSVVTSAFLVFPMMVGLGVTAKSVILILLTEKWLPAVPFLQVFCINYAFHPIHTANLQAIKGLGYSGTYLKLNIIKRVLGLITLVLSINYGVLAIVISQAFVSFISTFINAYPNKKILNYGYKEQATDLLPSLALALIMGVFVYLIESLNLSTSGTLLFQIVAGISIYFGLAKAFKMRPMNYLFEGITTILRKYKK